MLLEDKGLTETAYLSLIAMRAIEGEHLVLDPPGGERLRRDLDIVRKLYERSYDWHPKNAGVGEQRQGKTMREYIKSWITDWDIQRLYDAEDTIVIEPKGPDDLSEDKNFESPASAPPDEDA